MESVIERDIIILETIGEGISLKYITDTIGRGNAITVVAVVAAVLSAHTARALLASSVKN